MLLYPAGHPAIAATLGRIAAITDAAGAAGAAQDPVLPDGLLLDDRTPARADAALGELATLLHSHLIGEMTIHPGGDVDAWRTFLLLLGRTPESVRGDGGIARVWTTMAGRHVELREIDYAEVLRERAGGDPVVWQRVIANCLQGNAFDLDEAGDAGAARDRRRQRAAGEPDGVAREPRRKRRRHRPQDRGPDAHAARHRRRGVEEGAGAARAGAAQHGDRRSAAARPRCCSA